jgi:hypothetical protein
MQSLLPTITYKILTAREARITIRDIAIIASVIINILALRERGIVSAGLRAVAEVKDRKR